MLGTREFRVGRRAERFLKTCGAFFPSSLTSFWQRVESGLGADFASRLDKALDLRLAGQVGPEAVYELQYDSPQSALLTAALVSPFLAPWLTFFENAELPDGDVLDLGSGNGLAAMFFATLRPEARVLGLDSSPAAVASATEIAATLNIPNVRFEVAAIDDGWQPGRSYPVVTSCTLLRELEPVSLPSVNFSTVRGISVGLEEGSSILARAASRALDAGGAYLSLERNPTTEDLATWIGAMQAAGLGVDLRGSAPIRVHSVFQDSEEHLHALVARDGVPLVDLEGLMSWLIKERPDAPELSQELELKRHLPLELIGGWHVDVVDDQGPGQTKLGIFLDATSRFILYYSTSRGSRRVFSARTGDPEPLFAEATSWIEQVKLDPSVRSIRDLDPAEVSVF